ncbi:VWA domain-containing protein [bacterium]|nr:VWA domain-containing protein [bacterium]
MRGHRYWRVLIVVPLACLLWVQSLRAQIPSLKINIAEVSISDTTVRRGLHGNFPWPVLTLITVQDSAGRYVHGLADTTRWLLPDDTTETGIVVDSVWTRLLEYHKDNNALPANPDIKNSIPEYQVTEVYDVDGLGLSVVLAMDYSGSLGDDIYKSEDAARIFVRQMTVNDQAAIVKFTGKVTVFQGFTADTTKLMDAIGRPTEDREYTAMFDAAYTAVDIQRYQVSPRRPVVIYTDGKDNYSSHGVDDVITLARELETPLFTIGVGSSIDDVELQRMADETGGKYWHATTVDSLAKIYVDIYRLIRGYYVMAHGSTDPYYNGTWRTVDITLNDGGHYGAGLGYYYVPFRPADFRIHKTAITDSFTVSNGDTTNYLNTDDRVTYYIDLVNEGPSSSPSVTVFDVPPPQLTLESADPLPLDMQADTLQWTFGPMVMGAHERITLTFIVDTLDVNRSVDLLNTAWSEAEQDTVDNNDRDSVVVTYVPLLPVDLAVRKYAFSDSMAVLDSDTVYYAGPADIITYNVSVTNSGQQTAGNIEFIDILPANISLVSAPTDAATISGDTLSWTLSSLGSRGAVQNYIYTVTTADVLPPWQVEMINTVTVYCSLDSVPGNNSATDKFIALGPMPPDPLVRCNPVRVEPLDSVTIDVFTPVHAVRWDLRLEFEDDSELSYYADAFIDVTTLTPGVWTQVIPDFADTQMRTGNLEEKVAVIFETEDVWQTIRTDTAWFDITSTDVFFLDETDWHIEDEGPLGFRFKLSSNRNAQIIIYDISGGHIRSLYDGPAYAGWNRTSWDGLDDSGQQAGSGLYVAILRSGSFQKYRKFMLVR